MVFVMALVPSAKPGLQSAGASYIHPLGAASQFPIPISMASEPRFCLMLARVRRSVLSGSVVVETEVGES